MTSANDIASAENAQIAGWQLDDARNRELYRSLVKEHGLSSRALNWGSAATQRIRFEVLCDIGMASDASVLDVGCGTGDLCVYLRERGFAGRFVGVDITPEMVEVARARRLDAEFHVVDLLDCDADDLKRLRCDYVLSSGIFYFRQRAPQQFMEAMTRRFLDFANVGVAFNSLSTWADQPAKANEFRADPMAILDHCRSLTRRVTLRHDYHPGDVTFYMWCQPYPAASITGGQP